MTATATLITAIVGLITVLNQVGLIGDKGKEKTPTEEVVKKETSSASSETLSKADLEEIVKKVMKEENATKGKNKKEIEATVSEILKETKNKSASSESVKEITRAFLSNNKKFNNEEDVYHGEPEPDDYGGSYGGSTSSSVNVTGTWQDNNTGASYFFTQNGNSITFQEQSVNAYGALIISAEGSGTISNRNISVNYVTMFNTTGTANMTVSPNGNNITGTFRDNVSGVTVTMNLWR